MAAWRLQLLWAAAALGGGRAASASSPGVGAPQCPEKPLALPHMGVCPHRAENDVCRVCAAGYNGGSILSHPTCTCTDSPPFGLRWTCNSGTCAPQCVGPPVPGAMNCTGNIGATCSAPQCKDGFFPSCGGGDLGACRPYKCVANADGSFPPAVWQPDGTSNKELICTQQHCPGTLAVAPYVITARFAFGSCQASTSLGSKCDVQCRPGYQSAKPAAKCTCAAAAQPPLPGKPNVYWSCPGVGLSYCSEQPCATNAGLPEHVEPSRCIEEGHFGPPTNETKLPGGLPAAIFPPRSVCTVSCAAGYHADQGKGGTFQFQCGQNGKWVPVAGSGSGWSIGTKPGTCSGDVCPAWHSGRTGAARWSVDNGTVEFTAAGPDGEPVFSGMSSVHGGLTRATVTCQPGFVLRVGSSQLYPPQDFTFVAQCIAVGRTVAWNTPYAGLNPAQHPPVCVPLCPPEDSANSAPLCRNGGECDDGHRRHEYRCRCPEHDRDTEGTWFFGKHCERECTNAPKHAPDVSFCANGRQCTEDCQANSPFGCVEATASNRQYACDCKNSEGKGDTDGEKYTGKTCERLNPCHFDPPPCGAHGSCELSDHGDDYACVCESGYSGRNCETWSPGWTIVCVIVTALAMLPVGLPIPARITGPLGGPSITQRFCDSLRALKERKEIVQLPEGADAATWKGAVLMLLGVVDLFFDIALCMSLYNCDQMWLFSCATLSTVVTVGLTWFFAWKWFEFCSRSSEDSRRWFQEHKKLWAAIVFCSSSRLKSLEIVRFRWPRGELWSGVLDLPDSADQRYWLFVSNAGLYHYLVEDSIHVVISLALLVSTGNDTEACESDHMIDTFLRLLGLSDVNTVAMATLTFTGVSVVFGTISKVSQQYLVRALPEPEPAGGAAAAAAAAAAGAGAVGGGGGRSADVSRYSVGTKAQLFQSLSSDPELNAHHLSLRHEQQEEEEHDDDEQHEGPEAPAQQHDRRGKGGGLPSPPPPAPELVTEMGAGAGAGAELLASLAMSRPASPSPGGAE